MKGLFLIAALTFSAVSNAQRVVRKGMREKNPKPVAMSAPAKYTIAELNGKWQEIKRSNGNDISFTDSMLLSIKNNRGEIRDATGMAMNMKGEALIDAPATLIVAGDSYAITGLTNGRLMLRGNDYLRVLQKVDEFYYETVGKDSIKMFSYGAPVVADPRSLIGEWIVYRRDAQPGYLTGSSLLIKSISFSENNIGESVTYTGNQSSIVDKIDFKVDGTTLSITIKDAVYNYTVFKADGSELIFGNAEGVVNYAKR